MSNMHLFFHMVYMTLEMVGISKYYHSLFIMLDKSTWTQSYRVEGEEPD